jgi:hypothetical protein
LEAIEIPIERRETMDALWAAIGRLDLDLKMALLLRDLVGLSCLEISDALEITLATVKWRIYRAPAKKYSSGWPSKGSWPTSPRSARGCRGLSANARVFRRRELLRMAGGRRILLH